MGCNMKKNNRRKSVTFKTVLSLLLAASLVAINIGIDTFAANVNQVANANSVENYDDVIEDMHVIEASDVIESPEVENAEEVYFSEKILGSARYTGEWDKYSSKYFYNQLSDDEKVVWDRIDALAYSYLDGSNKNTDFGTTTYSGGSAPVLGKVDCTDSNGNPIFNSSSELSDFACMFRASNPQYYYLNNSIIFGSDYSYLYLGVYEGFENAHNRSDATAAVRHTLDQWLSDIGEPSSETDKLSKAKAAHDKISANVTYNDEVVSSSSPQGAGLSHDEDEQYYTQSMYSALILGTTVCVGYSETYDALCNALGIDSVSITSPSHQWNEIRVNNSWYNVDCTWDDSSNILRYSYFMLDDVSFGNESTAANRQAHTPIEFWIGIKPTCTQNIGSTSAKAGTSLPTPMGTVDTPEFSVEKNGNSYNITVTDATAGATIYYTTDGSTPSPAYSKSSIIDSGDKINVTDYSTVRAMAVKDKYLDSDVATPTYSGDPDTPDTPDTPDEPDCDIDGHDWDSPFYVWSSDGKQCIATRICKRDSSHIESEEGVVTSKVIIPPTTKSKGTTEYTATFVNAAFETQTKQLQDIPAVEPEPEYSNVVSIDEDAGKALVRNEYTNQTDLVDITIIQQSKIYRMYNPITAEHLYTKDAGEVVYLVSIGWNHEAESDYTVVDARDADATPVYRLFNPYTDTHHYTESVGEVEYDVSMGWIYERISHYVYDKDSTKGTPQWKLYHPSGPHNWTSDTKEIEWLESTDWINEGIRWRVL